MRHMTSTSGEIRNWTTRSAARTTPSWRTECCWRITISCNVVMRSGGTTSMVTDTWPNSSEPTRAAE